MLGGVELRQLDKYVCALMQCAIQTEDGETNQQVTHSRSPWHLKAFFTAVMAEGH